MLSDFFTKNKIHKIQLGCGPHKLNGWLNTDLTNNGDKDIFELDVTCPRWPFEDKTFDYVFCEHMIEHITYKQAAHMLTECFRILKPGGKIRVVTPDINFLINLYLNKEKTENKDYIRWSIANFTPWAPKVDPIFLFNNFMRDWGHTFIYDKASLINSLNNAGFRLVEEFDLCNSDDFELTNLENPERMPAGFLKLESMCIQGSK